MKSGVNGGKKRACAHQTAGTSPRQSLPSRCGAARWLGEATWPQGCALVSAQRRAARPEQRNVRCGSARRTVGRRYVRRHRVGQRHGGAVQSIAQRQLVEQNAVCRRMVAQEKWQQCVAVVRYCCGKGRVRRRRRRGVDRRQTRHTLRHRWQPGMHPVQRAAMGHLVQPPQRGHGHQGQQQPGQRQPHHGLWHRQTAPAATARALPRRALGRRWRGWETTRGEGHEKKNVKKTRCLKIAGDPAIISPGRPPPRGSTGRTGRCAAP